MDKKKVEKLAAQLNEKIDKRVKEKGNKQLSHLDEQIKQQMIKEISEEIQKKLKKEFEKLMQEQSLHSAIPLQTNQSAEISIDSAHADFSKLLQQLPLHVNLYLNINQSQNPEQITVRDINHSALAIKDSNAVEHPINSTIAQADSHTSQERRSYYLMEDDEM